MNFHEEFRAIRYRPTAMLRVSGPDAASFLQGQFTNDLRGLEAGRSVYGLWLDRKGKVVADSQVIRSPEADTFWAASLTSPAPVLLTRLESYLVADEVVIEDETAAWQGLSAVGTGALGRLSGAAAGRGFVFGGRRSAGESAEWLFPAGNAVEAEAAVRGLPELTAEEAERLRIEAGIPAVPADIGPSELPQEGGLDSALSYSKGCYLGQEVMARLKSRGRLRRRLAKVAGEGLVPALPAALWDGERRLGELRSAAAAGPGFEGLALIALPAEAAFASLRLSFSPGAQRVVSLCG